MNLKAVVIGLRPVASVMSLHKILTWKNHSRVQTVQQLYSFLTVATVDDLTVGFIHITH